MLYARDSWQLTIRSSYRAGLVEGLRVITPPVSSFMFDPSPCSQTTELDVEKRKQYEDIVNGERKVGESSQEDFGKEQNEKQMQRMNAIILHAKNVGEEVLKENVSLDQTSTIFVSSEISISLQCIAALMMAVSEHQVV